MTLKEAREIAKDLRRQQKMGMIFGERTTAAVILYDRVTELEKFVEGIMIWYDKDDDSLGDTVDIFENARWLLEEETP